MGVSGCRSLSLNANLKMRSLDFYLANLQEKTQFVSDGMFIVHEEPLSILSIVYLRQD